MPTIAEQYNAALAEVRRRGQVNTVPTVSNEDVESIVASMKRADIWTASHAYSYGDVILPTVRNGHAYKCIQAGRSGTTEPTWLKSDFARQTEGSSNPILTWQENGHDYANVYDIESALFLVWDQKAESVAHLHDLRQSQSDESVSQIYQHCDAERKKYAPKLVA